MRLPCRFDRGRHSLVARLIEGARFGSVSLRFVAVVISQPLADHRQGAVPRGSTRIINGLTITLVTLVNYSASAGAIGGGDCDVESATVISVLI